MEIDLMTGWLSPAEAARRLGVTGTRIRQMMQEGKLEFLQTPIGRIVSAASVDRLCQRYMTRCTSRRGKTTNAANSQANRDDL